MDTWTPSVRRRAHSLKERGSARAPVSQDATCDLLSRRTSPAYAVRSLCAFRRSGVPLAFAHTRNRHARKNAGFGEGIAIGKGFRFSTAVHVHDEQAPDRFLAVIGLCRTREHQNALLALQVIAMRHEVLFPDRSRVWFIDA